MLSKDWIEAEAVKMQPSFDIGNEICFLKMFKVSFNTIAHNSSNYAPYIIRGVILLFHSMRMSVMSRGFVSTLKRASTFN
jgi:hypothetical protein